MMDPREMDRLADEAAARAKRENIKPKVFGTYMAEPAHRNMLLDSLRSVPFMGRYAPQDWQIVPRAELRTPETMSPDRLRWLACDDDYVFVDSSGFGSTSEPSLTFDEFANLVAANPLLGWAIAEVGQFQVVVGAFRHLDNVPAPKRPPVMTMGELAKAFVAGKPGRCHNAMTDGREYTLHASVIARKNDDDSVTFDWCGWYTKTTTTHMANIIQAMGRNPGAHLKTPGEADKAGQGAFTVS
jgi:hypothetical protein